jgi:polysaccharide export outer membrane protein
MSNTNIYCMKRRISKNILIKLFVVLVAIGLYSCGSTKQLKYFQDIPDTTKLASIKLANFTAPLIRPDQVLSVNIYTIDVNATQSINIVNTVAVSTQGAVLGLMQVGSLLTLLEILNCPN